MNIKILRRFRTHGIGHLAGVPFRRARKFIHLWREERLYREKDYLDISNTVFPGIDLEHFSESINQRLNSHATGLGNYLHLLLMRFSTASSELEELTHRVALIENGVFEVYGAHKRFKSKIDWCSDIKTDHKWPKRFFRRYRFGEHDNRQMGDPRATVELNRQQHLPLLAAAAIVTGDHSHADRALDHMCGWINDNPPFYSINWFGVMESALRFYSWGLTLALLARASALDPVRLKQIIFSLYQQYRFVIDNLSVHLKKTKGASNPKNNHTIIELCGILFIQRLLGCLQPFSMNDAQNPYERLLLEELKRQTHADGMNVEQSTSYARFVLEALILTRLADDEPNVPSEIDNYIHKYYNTLTAFQTVNGRFHLVGDDDNGHVVIPAGTPLPDDLSEIRTMHSALPCAQPVQGPSEVSKFTESGHWLYRGNWNGKELLVYFRCGPMDFPDTPGYAPHAHCDLLSLCVYFDGRPVFVDSGTYSYSDLAWRDYFRMEQAHNTVFIRGRKQATFRGQFDSASHAHAELSTAEANLARGELTYTDSGEPATVTRKIRVVPGDGTIEVTDSILAKSEVTVEWSLNVAPDINLRTTAQLDLGDHLIDIEGLGKIEQVDGWYSPAYGRKQSNYRLVASADVSDGHSSVTWRIIFREKDHDED
jgi:hypothetical protein